MTDHLHINPVDRARIATRWVVVTLWALHIWASLIIMAVIVSWGDETVLGAMFSTCTFGIGATLVILLIDRGADTLIARFAIPIPAPAEVKETLTRTVTTSAAPEGEGGNK